MRTERNQRPEIPPVHRENIRRLIPFRDSNIGRIGQIQTKIHVTRLHPPRGPQQIRADHRNLDAPLVFLRQQPVVDA